MVRNLFDKRGKLLLFMWIVPAVFIGGLQPLSSQGILPVTQDDLNQLTWRHIGPWSFSGRITNFAVPRGQSQAYYVLTATGGLWKTEDGGIHFSPLFDKFGMMSMGYLAIAPSDAKILYLGTGESIHARAAYHGKGVFKSVDAGKTWSCIGLEKSYFISKIEVDPRNPDVAYAACEGKLYDNAMDCERGLYKTSDGGKTWSRVLELADRGVVDVIMDPQNPDVLIATSYKVFRRAWTYIDRQDGNFVYKTTDGGKTWKKLAGGLPDLAKVKTGRNGLAFYEKNPKIVYLRLDEEANLGFSERDGASLFREGGTFRDGCYLNKFNSHQIPAGLARFVPLKPLRADSEKDLVKKLNDLVKDPDFASGARPDLQAFNKAARKLYAKDSDVLESADEIEKTMRREAEKPDLFLKINRLVILAFFAGSEGLDLSDGVKVTNPDKVSLNKDFSGLLTYDPKDIKDEKDLISRLPELSSRRDFTSKLKIDAKKVMSAARSAFQEKKDILEKFKGADDLANEFEETKGRYQVLNRYILQTLYGGALAIMTPVKKAGLIYRSDDQGETWTKMTEYKMSGGSDIVNQVEAGYNGRILVDPNDDKVIYAHETRTTKSTDSGKTFKFAGWEGNGKVHVDSRAVWVDPLNSKHILNANDGGVSESWDGGAHWSQKETISAQQFYDVSTDDLVPYNVMGGTQDNGCWMGPSQNRNPYGVFPADWLYLPSGDGFYVVRDWWNPEYIYFESQFGYSRRLNLKTGESMSLSRRNSPEENAAGAPPQRYQWNAPIVLSPHNPGIVFVCSQYVNRSLRRGEKDSWAAVSPDLSKNDKERIDLSKKTNLQYGTIFTFAESPKKAGLYWAGTDDGNLQVSRDFGASWTNLTAQFYDQNGKPKKGIQGALIPYDRWVKRVLPSAHDEKTCYAVYSGYRTHSEDKTYVYVTRDLGSTWEDISGGMETPANDIEEDPDNPDVLYLATDYGLFVRFGRGGSWQTISSTAPHVIIKDLAIQKRERDLIIATYGRGIYIADIFPLKEFKEETFRKDAHLFDIKDVIWWNLFERRGQTLGEFAKAENPRPGGMIYYYLKNPAAKVLLKIKDVDGNPIMEISRTKVEKGLQKAFWNLTKKIEPEKLEGLDREEREKLTRLDPGLFLVTLNVDGKDVETKKLVVKPDPLNQP